jgi:hypothetical protein
LLLRDKTRPSRIPPLAAEITNGVVERTLGLPAGETTRDGRDGRDQR